jgi:hypothetical protein
LLTPKEIQKFEDDGLIVPDYRLPDDLMGELRSLTDRVVDETPDLRPEFLFSPHVRWEGQLDSSISDGFMMICKHSEILDSVEDLIGPDIIMWASRIFCKPAHTGMEIPWHQDGDGSWPIRPISSIAVWIAIDDVTSENGCMRYIPGSHKLGMAPHGFSERDDLAVSIVTEPNYVDSGKARNLVLQSGQFSIHHMFTVHSSMPNRSDQRRAGFAIRYMPATSHYDRAMVVESQSGVYDFDLANRPIYLMRGEDKCGLNDIAIGPVAPMVLKKVN